MTRARRAIDWRFAALAFGLLLVLGLFGGIAGTDPDEEYALASTAHGVGYALHRAVYYELQAPVWFGIVALWRTLDASAGFARLFSIACAIGTCFAARSIALRVRPGRDPFPFVALLALNPFFVYAALEVRVYAFAMLLSALWWLAFDDGFLDGEDRGARRRLAALSLVAIYTFYYLGFILAGGALALVVARRFAALRTYLIVGCALALAALPALFVIHATFAAVRSALPALGHVSLRTFAEPLLSFGLPTSYRWSEIPVLAAGLKAYKPIVLLALAALVVTAPRLGRREWAFVALAAGTWLAYPLCYLVVQLRFEEPRHFVTVFVPLAAAAYAVLTAPARRSRIVPAAVAALYAAFCFVTLWANYAGLSKAGDMRRTGAFVSARAAPDDVVAVFAPDAEPAFRRFYSGAAPVTGFPSEPDPERYDTARYVVHSVDEATAALERVAHGRRLWLVIYGRCQAGADNYGCDTLLRALRERYPAARVTRFYESEVVEVTAAAGRPNAGRSPARGSSSVSGESPDSRLKKAALSAIASV